MKCLVQRTYTVTEGVYVKAPDIVCALEKVRALKKPRWFLIERDSSQWSAENVPMERKAPR